MRKLSCFRRSVRILGDLVFGLIAAGAMTGVCRADVVTLKTIPKGAADQIGTVAPQQIRMTPTRPDVVKKLPEGLVSPLFGTLTIGPTESPTTVTILLDYLERATPLLLVDSEGAGDFSTLKPIAWATEDYKNNAGKGFARFYGSAMIPVRYGAETVLLSVGFQRWDANDPERALFKDVVIAYPDYAVGGEMKVNGKPYRVLLADIFGKGDYRPPAGGGPGVQLLIDVNGNGRFDRRGETFAANRPFNIKGITYEIRGIAASGTSFEIVKSAKTVPEIPPTPDLRPGKPAVPFDAKTMSGAAVKFPTQYRGKLVVLIFWATWCGDCRHEMPGFVRAYDGFHSQGVEFLGVSLDDANQAGVIRDYAKQTGMAWPTIYDGKRLNAQVAFLYDITAIPSAYVVDGATGNVLAGGPDLVGAKLLEALDKAVSRPK